MSDDPSRPELPGDVTPSESATPSEHAAPAATEPVSTLGEAHAPAGSTAAHTPAGIELGPSGFRAPRWPGRGEVFVAFRDITHVAVEPRAVAIGTSAGVVLMNRAQLGGEPAAREFADAVRERVFALPGGDERRARFERLDEKLRARRPWIAALLVALTGFVFALQALVPGFYEAAIYRPPLLALGEWWRYATAQFLHANLLHLAVNAAASLVAGAFVERSLGRAGALFVTGAAGLGAMFASRYGAYTELLGFSGIAAGFFGALLALEFLAPAEVPASARIPRTILVGAVALQAAIDLLPSLFPAFSAHTAALAHLGGFIAGALAALLARESARGLVLVGAAASVLVASASFGIVARNLLDPSPALERQARVMLTSPLAQNPGALNNLAWEIASSKHPSAHALESAAQLAEAAVRLTGRQEPTVLDTLAEVYFAQGRTQVAVEVIEEAIGLAPGEPYYEEQRKRFTGERAAGDRPESPAEVQPPHAPESDEDGGRDGDLEPPARPGEIDLPPGDEITV